MTTGLRATGPRATGLRATVLRGGTYLAARQVLSLAIHLVGVLLLTRAIGPRSYGLYAAALGVHTYLYYVTQCGLSVYLIRREGAPAADADAAPADGAPADANDADDYHQAFTLLLVIGCGALALALLALPLVGRWTRLEGFAPVARGMFAVLPLQLTALAASAKLERALDYRRVAAAELSGYLAFYAAALPLAWGGAGAWSPVAGFWAQQVTLAALYFWSSRYRPRLVWEPARIRPMLRYGLAYSGANWVWQLRELVNPLVVGRYAGVAAVGFVAFTVRLVDSLSFVKTAAYRLSIAVLARLQGDRRRLVDALGEGMRLQVLAGGPVLVAFGLAAPFAVGHVFGGRWTPILAVYPFVALAYLTNACFNLHSSSLYVVRRSWDVALFHAAHIVLFAGSALVLVPRLGMVGYGWAEMVALLSYAVVHARVARRIGAPDYAVAWLCWFACATLLFWRDLGWWSLAGPLTALVWPGAARQLRSYVVNVAGLIYAR